MLPVNYLHKGVEWPDFDLGPFKEVKELEIRRQRALSPLLVVVPGKRALLHRHILRM